MSPPSSNGRVATHGVRPTRALRRPRGLAASGFRACEGGRRGGVAEAVGAVGRCTRIACAAVVAVIVLGETTSARSSHRADGTAWGNGSRQGCGRYRRHHQQHQQAWQFFSSAPKTPSNHPARRNALQPGKASSLSTDAMRHGRLHVGSSVTAGGGGSSAVSPAQMYRVSRSEGQGRVTPSIDSGEARGRRVADGLQSPRSAMAGAGRDYPERLTVYSASTSIAEDLGGAFVAEQGEDVGRPTLPLLTEEDLTQLHAGQRVQKQTREGGSGSGSVVVDVRADTDVVLGLLTKYEDYGEMIDTVRKCEVIPGGDTDTSKVEVTVSRFRLHIRVVMSLLRERNMVKFELDPDCTKAGRAVLGEATGFFFVESPPDRPGYSRVWMLAKVDVNRFVPGGVVDYAAGRALPRASNWIKPTCEAAQRRKVRESGKSATAAGTTST